MTEFRVPQGEALGGSPGALTRDATKLAHSKVICSPPLEKPFLSQPRKPIPNNMYVPSAA